MKRLLPVAVVLVILGLIVTLCLRAFSDPVPIARLQKLQKGMTQDEVRSVLGPPSAVYEGQWTYQRQLVFGFVNIHWAADGTFDGEVNYERF